MTVENLWEQYAATWSLGDDRRQARLDGCVTPDVTYCDPNSVIDGHQALSEYMAAFQASVPGSSFEIRAVLAHHDRSLARWVLRGPDQETLQTGTSFASHAGDGRLQSITGFFDSPGDGGPQ